MCNALGDEIKYVEVKPAGKNVGWECPKCGYCWGWFVRGCENCNKPEVESSQVWPSIGTITSEKDKHWWIIYTDGKQMYMDKDGKLFPIEEEE